LLSALGNRGVAGACLRADARRAGAAALGAMGIRRGFRGGLSGAAADLGLVARRDDAELSAPDDLPELDMSMIRKSGDRFSLRQTRSVCAEIMLNKRIRTSRTRRRAASSVDGGSSSASRSGTAPNRRSGDYSS